ncbi:cytospin-A-like [Sinocyclocheilus anshuiensis]|uniref:cytospin-A-like n=1 Tax=Sinocyclocheilus anshuiensis TaxID=1608454 RepID=UPI0007B991C8|nr:PREDICTED: cytospin-A-like [Sinocyclocheilus anshuiensis]
MGNNSGKERHGSSGTAAEMYETPPASPYSVVTTCSPTTQLVSISKCTSTATPESAQDALSSTNQNVEPLLDCRTGPAKEAEEGLKMTESPGQVSYLSDVCMNGDTEVDAKLLQECLNTLQLNNIEESTHILNDLLKCFLVEREKMKEELRSCKEKIQFVLDTLVSKIPSFEDRGKRNRKSHCSQRSLCQLPSDYPDVVVNGTSQPSVTMTTVSTSQSKTRAVSLDQQNNKTSTNRDKKVENSLLQTCNSSVLDVTNKINRTRTQEDFLSGLRSLRLHGSSRRNSLLRWCQGRTQGYKNIEITNFSSCWVDGLAFCAIYHSYLPSHIPYDKLSPENKKENLTLAFQTGEGFGISASLTVEEMLKEEAPDWHRVLEYVESIYRHFEM